MSNNAQIITLNKKGYKASDEYMKITENQTEVIMLPAGKAIREITAKVIINFTTAATTAPTYITKLGFLKMLRNISISDNNNEPIRNYSGRALYVKHITDFHVTPSEKMSWGSDSLGFSNSSAALTVSKSYVAKIEITLGVDIIRPEYGENLALIRRPKDDGLKLSIEFGSFNDVFGSANQPSFVSGTVNFDIESRNIDLPFNRMRLRTYTNTENILAAQTPWKKELLVAPNLYLWEIEIYPHCTVGSMKDVYARDLLTNHAFYKNDDTPLQQYNNSFTNSWRRRNRASIAVVNPQSTAITFAEDERGLNLAMKDDNSIYCNQNEYNLQQYQCDLMGRLDSLIDTSDLSSLQLRGSVDPSGYTDAKLEIVTTYLEATPEAIAEAKMLLAA